MAIELYDIEADDELPVRGTPAPEPAPCLVLPTAVDGKLAPALERRLLAVSAPAGYGKTQAMAALWRLACAKGWQALWLQLGPADSDPAVMLRSLRAVLGLPQATHGADPHADHDANPGAALLQILQSELLPRTILFLDDFHFVRDPALHAAISQWLETAPSGAVLALISRGTLPLRLSRLRLMQQVYELDAEDLSLSPDETATLLQQRGLTLPPEQVGALHAATEGWPAGLQLAGGVLAGRPAAARTTADGPSGGRAGAGGEFGAGDRDVAAYFDELVLPELPPALLRLAERAALFDRFSVEFCRDVLAMPDAAELLADAGARGLFLSPLDRRGQWFRFHPLFAAFLRRQMQRTAAEETQALYGAASRWCERQGMIGEAICHAFNAGDLPMALDLIRRNAERALGLHGGVAELAAWIGKLPRERIDGTLALCAPHVWLLLQEGRLDEAVAELPALEASMAAAGADEPEPLQRVAQLLRCALLALSGSSAAAGQASAAWQARWQRGASLMEMGTALLVEGQAGYLGDNPGQAAARLEQSRQHFQRAGASTGMALAAAIEAMASLEQGEMAHGAAGLASVREQMTARPQEPGAIALAMAEAHYCYEENRLGDARRLLDALPPLAGNGEYQLQAALLRARLAHAAGRHDEARQLLGDAASAAGRAGQRRAVLLLQAGRIELLLRDGQLEAALRLAPAAGLASDGVTVTAAGLSVHDLLALRTVAMRLLSARGQHLRAQLLLRDLLKEARGQGRKRQAVKLLCMRAALLARHGEQKEALRVMLDAMGSGAAAGLCRTIVDESAGLAELIADIAGRPQQPHAEQAEIPQAWLEQLLSACGSNVPPVAKPASLPSAGSGLRELATESVLSTREVQVLRLVEAGFRNSEMATQLFLSEMTVKWHLRNIYGKLSVRNRTGALARAREMRLI